MREYSLAYLTVFDVGPLQAVQIAAQAGYAFVGMRLLPAAVTEGLYPLLSDPQLLREVSAALRDTGVRVGDIELVWLRPEMDFPLLQSFLERGDQLGARHVIVAGDDVEEARLVEHFSRLCELAKPHGLSVDLEFMPWTKVPNLACASRIVQSASQPNGGLLIDTLHFDRSGSSVQDLASVPRDWLHFVQLCDAPANYSPTKESLIHTARSERLNPGEGDIDLLSILRPLPADLVVSVEVPKRVLSATVPALERARQALDASRSVLMRM